MRRGLPRRRIISKLLAEPFGILFGSASILFFGLAISTGFRPEIARNGPAIYSSALLVIVAAVGASLCRHWWQEKATLIESEHYLVLVVLALMAFALIGSANYSIYRIHPRSFTIDAELQARLSGSARTGYTKSLQASIARRTTVEQLVTRLSAADGPSIHRIAIASPGAGRKHILVLPFADTKMTFTYIPPWRTSPALRVLRSQGPEGVVDISSDSHYELASALRSIDSHERAVPKEQLVDLLRAAANWEDARWINPLEATIRRLNLRDYPLPLSLFMYQGAMDGLGNSPQYFSPMSAGTRALALFGAFLRYVFFGFFLTLLSKSWTISIKGGTTEEADA